MKILKKFSYLLVTMLLLSGISFAQDMNPEAGKLFNEGNALLKQGNYGSAIDKYNAALKIEKDYRTLYQLGVAQKKSGNMQTSKNSFEEVIKLKPDFEAGYNALGGVYFSMGNYTAAATNFEKVLNTTSKANVKKKVKKNLALVYTKLGNDALGSGNAAKGIEYLKKAVEYDNYDAAYLSLAKIYTELGQYDSAIAAAQNALKHRSKIGKGGPYYYMGLSYKNKGDLTKAKEMFNLAKSDASYRKATEYELSLIN